MKVVIQLHKTVIESYYKSVGKNVLTAFYEYIIRDNEEFDPDNIICYAWRGVDDYGNYTFQCSVNGEELSLPYILALHDDGYKICAGKFKI